MLGGGIMKIKIIYLLYDFYFTFNIKVVKFVKLHQQVEIELMTLNNINIHGWIYFFFLLKHLTKIKGKVYNWKKVELSFQII